MNYRTLHNESNGSNITMEESMRAQRLVDQIDSAASKSATWKVPWRTMHVLISLLTIVSGFATFLPLGYVNKYFYPHCLLWANVKFKYIKANSTAMVDYPTSVWGKQMKCEFATFSPVVASIHAFIWGWFFLLMSSAFHRKNHEFSMLIPSLLMHSITFVMVFVSSCYINEGVDVWCSNFYREINTKDIGRKMVCSDSQTINWNIFTQKNRFYTFLSTARVATWFLTLCVLCQCVAVAYQIYSGIMEENAEIDKNNSARNKQKSLQSSYISYRRFTDRAPDSSSWRCDSRSGSVIFRPSPERPGSGRVMFRDTPDDPDIL